METVCFSETLVSTYESTRHHSPEQHRHFHRRENLTFLSYADKQEIVLINLLHETTFMQLVSYVHGPLTFI
jgi:hypothetical protein